jgi:hypothetical protein
MKNLNKLQDKAFKYILQALPLKYYYRIKLTTLYFINNNPLITEKQGKYSQNEEDVILENIIKMAVTVPKTFIEFGVGDGFQNNTLNLVMRNYHGVWVGNEELKVTDAIYKNISYIKQQVTLENLAEITNDIKIGKIGVLSVDLDGNDWHFVNFLLNLKELNPEIFIVEFNASYGEKVEYIMDYDASHVWNGSNNFGASLLSYKELFKKFGYFLCAVNLTGVNAFFIKNDYKYKFEWQFKNSDKMYAKQFRYYKEYRKLLNHNLVNSELENL